LLNLAINARDAMKGEGTITVSAENVALDKEACAGRELSPGEYVLLKVSDSGSGMAPNVLARAFEPFFTTKPDGHGTGLGLSMVFGFVKQTGGHIEIISTVDSGTEVRMYFPRSLRPEMLETPNHTITFAGGHETILVVEDDEAVRATSVELLQQAGYNTLVAANGDDAMAILRSGAAIDLIFTDVVMPGLIKSADLAIWARQQSPQVPVLFTSGHTRDVLSRTHELGSSTFLLSKPYGPDALGEMIRAALRG
jgi:CheY-like chemotaxis protein